MCDDRETLIAYLYDEATAAERRQVDAHLATCAECREELRSLRGVRQDLLAWDVPAHESVWKPFASPQPVAWWRQVPAWGLAAAAALGLMGGLIIGGLISAPIAGRFVAVLPRSVLGVAVGLLVLARNLLTIIAHRQAARAARGFGLPQRRPHDHRVQADDQVVQEPDGVGHDHAGRQDGARHQGVRHVRLEGHHGQGRVGREKLRSEADRP